MLELFQSCLGITSSKSVLAEKEGRLGKRDLGRHAYENRMPEWLYRMLEEREKQNLQDAPPGILDVLHKLLEHEQNVESAYLCSSDLWYIGKIKFKGKDEGNDFCGYRNIQMLFSYLIATKRQGLGHLQENVPTIFDIQDMIEDAWVQGFNESGRVQTGGIKATRKHIGTPEAQALLRSLKIPCKADRFEDHQGDTPAYEQLLDSVEEYFAISAATSCDSSPKTQSSRLPPIYLQRPRHSMTIVGIEKHKDSSRNLLVFDPAYSPSMEVLKSLNPDSTTTSLQPSISLIKPYRRGKRYLQRYHAFETLRLFVPA